MHFGVGAPKLWAMDGTGMWPVISQGAQQKGSSG